MFMVINRKELNKELTRILQNHSYDEVLEILRKIVWAAPDGTPGAEFWFFSILHNFFMQILCILPIDRNPEMWYTL